MDDITEIRSLIKTVCFLNRAAEYASRCARTARDETERHIWTSTVRNVNLERDDTFRMLDKIVWS